MRGAWVGDSSPVEVSPQHLLPFHEESEQSNMLMHRQRTSLSMSHSSHSLSQMPRDLRNRGTSAGAFIV